MIVDAHLDLAYNVTTGRNVLLPAAQQPQDKDGIPTVGLPDMRAANIRLFCGTIFALPQGTSIDGHPTIGYTTPDQARTQGLAQLKIYQQWQSAGHIRIVKSKSQLPSPATSMPPSSTSPLDMILLMEGADVLRSPDDLPEWIEAGLRIVGLAWKRTRYSGGTDAPGPLTQEGKDMVRAIDAAKLIHDASHLSEESFWNLHDLATGPIMASHSNCRSIVGHDPIGRHLTDDMIRAIASRPGGGVIGFVFYEKFFLPHTVLGTRKAALDDLLNHVDHICQLTGSARHVGIGSDLDGGFGRGQIPHEIHSIADLPKIATALSSRGYSDADIAAIMGGNWLSFFQRNLA